MNKIESDNCFRIFGHRPNLSVFRGKICLVSVTACHHVWTLLNFFGHTQPILCTNEKFQGLIITEAPMYDFERSFSFYQELVMCEITPKNYFPRANRVFTKSKNRITRIKERQCLESHSTSHLNLALQYAFLFSLCILHVKYD